MAEPRAGLPRTAILAIGLVVAVLWIAMAAAALWSAAQGLANDRLDWGVGWGLVGMLLLFAGVAAGFGTWWHEHRVRQSD